MTKSLYTHLLIDTSSVLRRLVYVTTKRNWEYDCPHKHGWGCYLDFKTKCSDGIVDSNQLDFSNLPTYDYIAAGAGNGFLERNASVSYTHLTLPTNREV